MIVLADRQNTVVPLPEKQLLNRAEAAHMCGENSVTTFNKLVAAGYYPGPVERPLRGKRWSKAALQQRLDQISGVSSHAGDTINLDEEFGFVG